MMSRLLTMKDLIIQAFQEGQWGNIIHGLDVHVDRGEVLGLIGESGAGKSTIGIASMGFCRPGCRIVSGSIKFGDTELTTASESVLRKIRGVHISYVAQSAAAAFNPAHRLIAKKMLESYSRDSICPIQAISASAILIKSPVASFSAPWSPWPWLVSRT